MSNSDSLNEATGEKKASFFGPYLDAIFELDTFMELAWAGLGYASVATRMQETLRRIAKEGRLDVNVASDEIYKDKLRRAAELERFAGGGGERL